MMVIVLSEILGGDSSMAKTKAKKGTLRIKFAVYIGNGGDGSANVQFFPTTKIAEKVAKKKDERFDEDIREHEFVVDPVTGKIISGFDTIGE